MRDLPRRLAFAGDWHANTQWATRMIRHSADEGAQAILHLGDFGMRFMRSYVQDVNKALRDTGLSLYFVDGNHEDFPKLRSFPLLGDGTRQLASHLFHLPRGYRFTIDGVGFLACGGGVSVDKHRRAEGQSWWPEEQISAADIGTCENGGRTHVLLAHDCPAGVEIPHLDKTSPMFPAAAIRESEIHRSKLLAIASATRPAVIFHGHYHRAYTARVNLGWGPVRVQGLDCDASERHDNVAVYDTAQIKGWAGLAADPSADLSGGPAGGAA